MEELLSSLLTHEIRLNYDEEQAPKGDRRRGLALKPKEVEESEDEEDEDNDVEMAMYTRRFKRFMRKAGHGKKTRIKSQRRIHQENTKRAVKRNLRRISQSFVTNVTNWDM